MYYQGAPLVASAAGALIENGTAKYSANQTLIALIFTARFSKPLFIRIIPHSHYFPLTNI